MAHATILIADDNERVLEVLRRVLEEPDTDVIAVKDGAAALDALRWSTPDLIILDVRMPGLDGLQVCAALRREPCYRNIPILMLSGLGGDSHELSGRWAGADRYMTKPFNVNRLKDQVAGLLSRGRGQSEAAVR